MSDLENVERYADSLYGELEAEKHAHRKDNAYLLAENQRLREELADTETEKIERGTRIIQLREALRFWYGEVDKAQRLDNTGGDSAVSVTLCSWAEALAGDTE